MTMKKHLGQRIYTKHQGNIDLVSRIVYMDRRLTVRQLEETLSIPKTTIHHILTGDFIISRDVLDGYPNF